MCEGGRRNSIAVSGFENGRSMVSRLNATPAPQNPTLSVRSPETGVFVTMKYPSTPNMVAPITGTIQESA